ncbi:MAG: hypothetical protein V4642_05185 [Bacteroidota bacterium]
MNSDKLRAVAMPFLMLGLAAIAFGFNTKNDIFLYTGIAGIAGGLAFLKASVWKKPKGSRSWRRTEEDLKNSASSQE